MLSKYSEFQIIVWHLHIKDNSTAVKEGVPRDVIIDQTANMTLPDLALPEPELIHEYSNCNTE